MKNSAFSNFKVFAGNSHLELAEEIASIMGKPLGEAKVAKFSTGTYRNHRYPCGRRWRPDPGWRRWWCRPV